MKSPEGPRKVKNKNEDVIPEYGLEDGIKKLVSLIQEKISKGILPVIVRVAGGSACGKTTEVSEKIKRIFNEDEVLILSMDNHYFDKHHWVKMAKQGISKPNVDEPASINFASVEKNEEQLISGKTIEEPLYSHRMQEATKTVTEQPHNIIVEEGIFNLLLEKKSERHINVFVDTDTYGRMIRRVYRDVKYRMRPNETAADMLKYVLETVEPMYEKHVKPTMENADMIINNPFDPESETEKFELKEAQLNFKTELTSEKLLALGAKVIDQAEQVDYYYNPKNLDETGETLRIRHEFRIGEEENNEKETIFFWLQRT
ncbi:MAG: hypothetical protein WCS86_00425 [Candidatus Paceibacterota bacterium]